MNFKLQANRYVILVSVSLTLIQLCLFVYAEDKLDLQKIYNESQKTAQTLDPKLQELAKGGKGIEKIHEVLQNKEGKANHQTTELGKLPIAGEKAKENNTEKASCTKEECNVSHLMSTKAINEREAKLEEYGFRKDKEQFPEDNKGYIDKARHNAKKYESKFDAISGSYKDCKSKDHAYSYKEITECDEYYDVKYNNCPISQIVEIDPHYTYECNKKREEKEKKCQEELSLSCSETGESKAEIVIENADNRVKGEYSHPILRLWTGSGNWSGMPHPAECHNANFIAKFKIQDLEKIKKFVLKKATFRQFVLVRLNGVQIYHSLGGDRLTPGHYSFGRTGTVFYGGSRGVDCCMECWLSNREGTSVLTYANIEKDVKGLLVEGLNTIEMQVVYSFTGQIELAFAIGQEGCIKWQEQWQKQCEYY